MIGIILSMVFVAMGFYEFAMANVVNALSFFLVAAIFYVGYAVTYVVSAVNSRWQALKEASETVLKTLTKFKEDQK